MHIRNNQKVKEDQEGMFSFTRIVKNSLYDNGKSHNDQDVIQSSNYSRIVNNDLYAEKEENNPPPVYETINEKETKLVKYNLYIDQYPSSV